MLKPSLDQATKYRGGCFAMTALERAKHLYQGWEFEVERLDGVKRQWVVLVRDEQGALQGYL